MIVHLSKIFWNLRNEVIMLIVFIILLIIWPISGIINTFILKTTKNDFYIINIADYAVAFGTIILAVFTARLAKITYNEGIRQRAESRKERRRLRIKEQLEELYSPLRAEIEFFVHEKIPFDRKRDHFKTLMTLYKIKEKYEFLASEKLREELREYFNKLPRDSIFMRQLRVNKGSEYADKYYLEKLQTIIKTIINDFDDLMEKYNKLN